MVFDQINSEKNLCIEQSVKLDDNQFKIYIKILETFYPREVWHKYERHINMQLKAATTIYQKFSHLLRRVDSMLIAASFNPDARVRKAVIPLLLISGTKLAIQRVRDMMKVDEDKWVKDTAKNAFRTYESKSELK